MFLRIRFCRHGADILMKLDLVLCNNITTEEQVLVDAGVYKCTDEGKKQLRGL